MVGKVIVFTGHLTCQPNPERLVCIISYTLKCQVKVQRVQFHLRQAALCLPDSSGKCMQGEKWVTFDPKHRLKS